MVSKPLFRHLIIAIIAWCLLPATSAQDSITVLVPGVANQIVYSLEYANYLFFQINLDPTFSAVTFIAARDTTHSPITAYLSTTNPRPSKQHGYFLATNFTREYSAYALAMNFGSTISSLYIGVTVTDGYSTPAYLSAMAYVYPSSQAVPSQNGIINLPNGRILNQGQNPSLTVSWNPITSVTKYTFYVFNQYCNYNLSMVSLDYVKRYGTVLTHLNLPSSATTASIDLSGFDRSRDTFCITIVSDATPTIPSAIWMPETLYWPHVRVLAPSAPIRWGDLGPLLWTEIVLGSILIVGAPLAIVAHRIWLARRRKNKMREQSRFEISHDWINQ